VERAHKTLVHQGHNVTMCPTTGPFSAGEIAREQIARGADLIVVAGGDGTINEAAEGMIGSPVPLGILPFGTANVLAMELSLGHDPVRSARRIGELRPLRISVGRLTCEGVGQSARLPANGAGRTAAPRHFLLMAGIGLDAYIVHRVDARLKARAGKMAYWVAGWSLVGRRLAQFDVEIEGAPRRCSFALFSRVRNYGGDFEIAKSVRLTDDTFEAVLFEGETTTPYVKYFAGMALNRIRGLRGVEVTRTDRVRLEQRNGPVFVQVDGELAGTLPAEIRIVPDALTLLVPETYTPQQ